MTTATITTVTSEQLDKCHRIIDGQTVFYKVESQSDPALEYEVRYLRSARRFTCSCPAGKSGFSNCKTTCWHVRAAVAHDLEWKAEQKRQNDRHILLVDGLPASERTYQRVLADRGLSRRPTSVEVEQDARHYASRAFSILR